MLFSHHKLHTLIDLLLKIHILIALACVNASAKETDSRTSALADLVVDLIMASEEAQRAFAHIALDEMFNAYRTELNQAGGVGARSVDERKKQSRWSSATNNFLDELQEASRLLNFNAPLKLYADKKQLVLIVVGDRPIAVSGPRIGKEQEFEQHIVAAFCSQYECLKPVLSRRSAGASRSEKEFSAPGGWLLGQNRKTGYLTQDGLLFEFEDSTDRVKKGEAALTVIIELRRLAAALKQFQQSGGTIDWIEIAVRSAPVNEDQQVVLNNQGDYLRLWIPNLDKNRLVLREALPWLQARVRDEQYQLTIRDADLLLQ